MILILAIPFSLFITTSYLFNTKKLKESQDKVIKVSILEALVCFLFILSFALEGFLPRFLFFFLAFALLLITSYLLLLFQKELDSDIDWQIETIKNNIVIFFMTIFPFFIFLTIFRFQHPILQIILSLLAVVLLIALRKPSKVLFTPFYNKLSHFWQTTYALKYVVLWVFIGLFVAVSFFFDLPKQKVASFFNLSDHTTYLKFDGNPVNLVNHIYSSNVLSFMIDDQNHTTNNLYDYHLNGETLYLYNANNTVVSIDISSKRIIDETLLAPVSIIGESDFQFSIIKDWFFVANDTLYLLARTDLYEISNQTFTLLSDDIISSNTDRFVENGQTKFLKRINASTYEIYHLMHDALELTEQINIDTKPYEGLIVISEKLFNLIDHTYYLDENDQKAYPRYPGTPFYDDDRAVLYYAQEVIYGSTGVYETPLIKTEGLDNEQSVSIKDKTFSQSGIVVNDHVYLIQLKVKTIERIDILSNRFELAAIHNPLTYEPFFVGNKATLSYITNVKARDNGLEYLQVEVTPKGSKLTIRLLEPQNLGIKLPFYSHYALWMFIPIGIMLFIPITDYRKEITIFSFEKASFKKE